MDEDECGRYRRPDLFDEGVEDDPYAGEDLGEYPDWWRENIRRFNRYGLRPYRPPRFLDDEYTPEVVRALEAELDVKVRLRSVDPQETGEWSVWIDGEPVDSVERRRHSDGYTVYAVTSAEFRRIVRDAVG